MSRIAERLGFGRCVTRFFLMMGALALGQALYAQHPFYTQIYQDGIQAMRLDNRDMALEYLEISAFGLLDHPDYLADIYVRMTVLLRDRQDRSEPFVQALTRAKRLVTDQYVKPEKTPDELWQQFLIAAEQITPPPPPIPKDEVALRQYVTDHPDQLDAWLALWLIDEKQRDSRARQTLEEALTHHPSAVPLLERALVFSMNRDRGRSAADYAETLFGLSPRSPLVNEYYAIRAVDEKKWQDAEKFFALAAADWVLRDSSEASQALKRHQDREARALEQEQARREREASAQRDRQAKVDAAERQRREKAETEERERQLKADAAAQKKAEAAKKKQQIEEEQARLARLTAEKARLEKLKNEQEQSDGKERSNSELRNAKSETPKNIEKDPIRVLETRLRTNRDDMEARYQLVELYLDRDDAKRAGRELRRLGRKDGSSARYVEVFARYNYQLEKYKKNIDSLNGRNDLSDRARFFLGMSYFKMEQLDEAVKVLSSLSRTTFPELREVDQVYKEVEASEARMRDRVLIERSINQLERRLNRGTARPIDHIQLIDLYLDVNEWEKAGPLIEEGQKNFRANQEFRFFAGRLALYREKYSEASQLFQSLLNAGYRKRDIYFYAGLAAMNNGQEAVADYLFKMAVRNNVTLQEQIRTLRTKR